MDDPSNESEWIKCYAHFRGIVYWKDRNDQLRRTVALKSDNKHVLNVVDMRTDQGAVGWRTQTLWMLSRPPSYLTEADLKYITGK